MSIKTISVVIPVYNEEKNLPRLMQGLAAVMDKQAITYEVVFVNDASTDHSLEVLKKLDDQFPHMRIISFVKNAGQSAAFDAGFKIARGDVIVTMDADLQYDPADIPKLIQKLGPYDAVCGWRKNRKDPWIKLVSTKIANSIRNSLSHENIKDTGCSLKAIKHCYLTDMPMYRGMHRFLPTLLKLRGAKIVEVEVTHLPRKFGKSKYNIRNRAWRAFLDLLAVIWMKKRHLDYKMEVIK